MHYTDLIMIAFHAILLLALIGLVCIVLGFFAVVGLAIHSFF